tara:strand:+ start:123 stop:1424 length:1302 start_codon:yes stop_codon:yes gene_type:complete
MQNRIVRFLLKSTNIKDNEVKAALLSFGFAFTLMVGYFLLRPYRDALASDWSDAEVSFLWTLNFFISIGIVAVYGFAVSKMKFRKLVPGVYAFFAATFVIFYIGAQSSDDAVLVAKGYYLWISVFALFNTSVFWSFMSDTFNKDQAGRLFAMIAMGASVGASVGPLLQALLADRIGVANLLPIAAVIYLLPLPFIAVLSRLKETDLDNANLQSDAASRQIGGNPFAGFRDFIANPYLIGIGVFLILYTGIGSFVYLEQKNLLEPYDIDTRAVIYGYRDFVLNTLTYVLGFFVTGRLVSKAGMPVALPLVPIIAIAGMLILAFSPILIVAVGMHVVSKAGNYGLTRPAREMLFTQVSREERFKAKPVIDIVAYRGGDVIMGWFFTGLTQGLSLGLGAVAAVGAGIAALWTYVGYLLGRRYERKVEAAAEEDPPN